MFGRFPIDRDNRRCVSGEVRFIIGRSDRASAVRPPQPDRVVRKAGHARSHDQPRKPRRGTCRLRQPRSVPSSGPRRIRRQGRRPPRRGPGRGRHQADRAGPRSPRRTADLAPEAADRLVGRCGRADRVAVPGRIRGRQRPSGRVPRGEQGRPGPDRWPGPLHRHPPRPRTRLLHRPRRDRQDLPGRGDGGRRSSGRGRSRRSSWSAPRSRRGSTSASSRATSKRRSIPTSVPCSTPSTT